MTHLFRDGDDDDTPDPVIDANDLGADGAPFGEGTPPEEDSIL